MPPSEHPAQSYQTPDSETLEDALDAAYDQDPDGPRYARLLCTVLAVAVRGILTDYEPDAPFDAVALALHVNEHGDVCALDGVYWTADGKLHRIEDGQARDALTEPTFHLNTGNHKDGWGPLCTRIDLFSEPGETYRLDLVAAAALPQEQSLGRCWRESCQQPRNGENPFCGAECAEADQAATTQYLADQHTANAEAIHSNPF